MLVVVVVALVVRAEPRRGDMQDLFTDEALSRQLGSSANGDFLLQAVGAGSRKIWTDEMSLLRCLEDLLNFLWAMVGVFIMRESMSMAATSILG